MLTHLRRTDLRDKPRRDMTRRSRDKMDRLPIPHPLREYSMFFIRRAQKRRQEEMPKTRTPAKSYEANRATIDSRHQAAIASWHDQDGPRITLTKRHIAAARTTRGAFTKAQVQIFGWPSTIGLPKGWAYGLRGQEVPLSMFDAFYERRDVYAGSAKGNHLKITKHDVHCPRLWSETCTCG